MYGGNNSSFSTHLPEPQDVLAPGLEGQIARTEEDEACLGKGPWGLGRRGRILFGIGRE